MAKREHYSSEYKRELVELVRRLQLSYRQIATEVGINLNMLTRWLREASAGGARPSPVLLRHATKRWFASSPSGRKSLGSGISERRGSVLREAVTKRYTVVEH